MGNETDAEDLVQEAYLRGFSHLQVFDAATVGLGCWRSLRNRCFDRLKQRGARGQDTDFGRPADFQSGNRIDTGEEGRIGDGFSGGIADGVSRGVRTPGAGTIVVP